MVGVIVGVGLRGRGKVGVWDAAVVDPLGAEVRYLLWLYLPWLYWLWRRTVGRSAGQST